MADSKLTALSEISVPALEDLLYLVDDPAGTPASVKVSANRLGGLLTRAAFGFRLTTESGVPVSTSDRTAQGTIYLTPYHASQFCRLISLYDGTRWKLYTNAEISLALTASSGSIYDAFVYDNAGTLTLELSSAWTNDTTRADALTTQDGIYVKSGATTRRWVGTIRASGANVVEDSKNKRFVWNNYNRVRRSLVKMVTAGTTWTYSTASMRSANADTALRVEAVLGLAESHLSLSTTMLVTSGTLVGVNVGIGQDSTTVDSADANYRNAVNSGIYNLPRAEMSRIAPLGYHYWQWLEKGAGSGTQTWGDSDTGSLFGLLGFLEG